jgi:hypothetical protein
MESPKRFRKKPVVIEAMRWNGQNLQAILDWAGCKVGEGTDPDCLVVATLEGTMLARMGDWIIRGVKDEFYPCASDVFVMTYEAA